MCKNLTNTLYIIILIQIWCLSFSTKYQKY
nr:MAG TPA: hypothetical protein [Caudoviricetes sp.]